jgi:hypothetical protein
MISVRAWLPAVTAIVLSSWTLVFSQPSVDRSPETINMRRYTVSAPPGEGWKTQKDLATGLLMFRRDAPFTIISVAPYGLSESRTLDEDRVAAAIFDNEERIMRERGASSYLPSGVTRDHVIVSGKALHVMRYSIAQGGLQPPLNPLVIKYAMYLYFPKTPNGPQVYAFLIGAPLEIGSAVSSPDLAEINAVIGTFEAH